MFPRRLGFFFSLVASLFLLSALSLPAASLAAPVNLPIVYSYTGVWSGQTVNLTKVANVTVEGISGATLVGQISQFNTSDPADTALNGGSLNVWTVDNPGYPQFTGLYVVHNGNQGSQPTYVTLTFPQASPKQNLNLTLSALPNSFTVNQTRTVTWSVALSQPVNDGSITLSLTSPGGQTTQIESGSAPTSGGYSFTNDQLFNAPGTWTVTASWSGDSRYNPASGSTTVTVSGVTGGPTEPYSLTLTASPTSIPADGTSTSTITATVTGANGQPVAGDNVAFYPSTGATATVGSTGSDGQLSVPYTSGTTPGTATISAKELTDSATGSTTVTLTSPSYTYTGTWEGQTVTMTNVANVSVENLPDETLLSTQLQNFQTTDPKYTGLNGRSINVFTAPGEFPGVDVVHNGLQGSQSVYGTWTFTPQAQNYTYTGEWNGRTVTLTPVPGNLPTDATQQSEQLQNFQTNNPSYRSILGESLNAYTASEYPGLGLVESFGQLFTFPLPSATGAVAAYKVDVSSPQDFGAPFTFTVTAVDANGNPVATADNSVALSSSTNNVDFTSAATAPDKRAWVKLVNGTATVRAQDPVQETTTITAASWAGGTVQGSAQLTVVMGPHPLLWTPGVDLSINNGPAQRVADINFIDYLNGVKTNGQHGGFWPQGVGTGYSATWTGTLQIFWPGTYQFRNTADDTANATITVDGKTVTIPENSWTSGTNETVSVQLARGSYAVSVTQQETDGQGGSGDTLEWQPYWRSNLVAIPAFNFRSGQTPPGTLPNTVDFTIGNNRYVADGTTQTVDTTPFIASGRTYLSVRAVGNSLGMADSDIVWNPVDHTATFTYNGHVVVFTLGSQTYTVDGDPHEMDVAPIDRNGRIFVPGRYFATAFDYDVGWNDSTRQVTLTAPSGESVYHPDE